MTEWCQNKDCPKRKNQNQIRGSKGNKYYQSNKAVPYYQYWCSETCRKQWFSTHATTCINAVGIIDKQTLQIEDCWYVDYQYSWRNSDENPYNYILKNTLMGVSHPITQEQGQTPEQIANGHNWDTITDAQARELAVTLGLAS